MDDALILDLFFARDERAIQETDLKYGRTLCALSHNITGDERDAEECVNDTYLAVWNAIPPSRPVHYYAYLCRIVRNISFDAADRRAAKKRGANMITLCGELGEMLPDAPVPDDNIEELGRVIDGFLRSLDASSRLIFLRRYFYADPLSHLAALTGMSENSLAAKLFRLRGRLKKYLEEDGIYI